MLQELLAHELKFDLGVYRQMSNNFHVYTDLPLWKEYALTPPRTCTYNAYVAGENSTPTIPLLVYEETIEDFTLDCNSLIHLGAHTIFRTAFFNTVAVPIYAWWQERKLGDRNPSIRMAQCDWKVAIEAWAGRRV